MLLGACEQKTETVAPNPPDKKTENNTTIVNPAGGRDTVKEKETNTTVNTMSTPASNTSIKAESSTTTTTSTPNP